jgi:hypothetical protein
MSIFIEAVPMRLKKPKVIHQETILLEARPDQVKAFILTAERILDYYPSGIDCGDIETGRSFFCRGKSGVSLLELEESQSDNNTCVLKVTTSLKAKPPYTAEKIRHAVFFTMYEDWKVEPHGTGSKLTKTWRDLEKHQLRFMPLQLIVRRSAKEESAKLKNAWEKAAQSSIAES